MSTKTIFSSNTSSSNTAKADYNRQPVRRFEQNPILTSLDPSICSFIRMQTKTAMSGFKLSISYLSPSPYPPRPPITEKGKPTLTAAELQLDRSKLEAHCRTREEIRFPLFITPLKGPEKIRFNVIHVLPGVGLSYRITRTYIKIVRLNRDEICNHKDKSAGRIHRIT